MGLDRGFDIYDDRVSLKHRKTYQDTATGVVRRALQQLGTTRPDRPVFLFVHFYDPHGPLTPPAAFRNRFVASTEYTPLAQQPWTRRAYMERVRSGAVTEADKELGRALYLAEVSYMDHELGRLLQALKERGLLDNAVLILTADHGQNLAENGDLAFSHGFGVHNEVMQVPLIVVGYGVGLPKGRVVQRRLSMSGLAPTLERLLGLQPELGQGMDFYSTLRAGPVWDDEGWPSRPQWPIPMEATRPISKPRPRALRLGNSVLYQQVERWEHERQFTGPQGLEDWMTKWLLAWQAVAPNARSQDMDEQTIEALKALGYLDESSSK
jgi:hypothetical protein